MEGCGRPKPDKWTINLLGLYDSCKQRGALPEAGGVLDQAVDLMYWFDLIDRINNDFKAEKAEREETKWQMSKRI